MQGGLLETFYFLFESDASNMNKGLKEADDNNDKLAKNLTKTDQTAKAVGETFLNVAKSAGTMLASFLAFSTIKTFVVQQAELTAATGRSARAARMSVEDFSVYAAEVEAAGGSVESFTALMKKFGEFGRDPERVLKNIADRMRGMSDMQRLRFGESLGMDQGTVDLISKGSKGIEELIARRKQLGEVTQAQVEISKKFNRQMYDTGTVLDDIRRRIATALLPSFTAFFKHLETILIWMRDNKQFMVGFFGSIAGVLTAIYLPAVIRAAIATYALLAPYLLLIGAFVAFGAIVGLVYDDVMGFLNGQDSAIGELSKKWPWLGEAVKDFVKILQLLKDEAILIFNFISDLITQGPAKAIDNFKAKSKTIFDGIEKDFPNIAKGIKGISDTIEQMTLGLTDGFEAFGKILDIVIGKTTDGIEAIMNSWQAFKNIFGMSDVSASVNPIAKSSLFPDMPDATAAAVSNGQAQITAAQRNPLASITSNSIISSRSSGKVVNVTVKDTTVETNSNDPEAIGVAFSNHLGDQIKSAIDQNDDGILA